MSTARLTTITIGTDVQGLERTRMINEEMLNRALTKPKLSLIHITSLARAIAYKRYQGAS